jgi:hypothetical protein
MCANSEKKLKAWKILVTEDHKAQNKKQTYQWWMAPKKDVHYQWWWGYEKVRMVKCSEQVKENYIARMVKK